MIDNIEKVKLVGEGFMALTSQGFFYLVKIIKTPELVKFFPMKEILDFSNDIDFLVIPATCSKSKNIEMLITNEKGNGVIHVEQKKEFIKDNNKDTIKSLTIIKNDKIEPYNINNANNEDKSSLGKIITMAISPSNAQIALYNNKGTVFFFHSTLDFDLSKFPRMTVKYEINKYLT